MGAHPSPGPAREAGTKQLLPERWPRKHSLNLGQGSCGLSRVPTLPPETLCPFAIQKA